MNDLIATRKRLRARRVKPGTVVRFVSYRYSLRTKTSERLWWPPMISCGLLKCLALAIVAKLRHPDCRVRIHRIEWRPCQGDTIEVFGITKPDRVHLRGDR